MSPNQAKKRKRGNDRVDRIVDTSKPTAVYSPSTGRSYTLSIAVPGSIVANAQSHEQKTALAGQIARALAVFCVDEVVVFDDSQAPAPRTLDSSHTSGNHVSNDPAYTGFSDPNHFLSHLLSYLETPPHLRKHLFPLHPNLRTAGTLPSLDMPHHLRSHEWCQYREGVTIEPDPQPDQIMKPKKRKSSHHESTTTLVDAGLPQPVSVPTAISPKTRVTLKFSTVKPPVNLQNGSMTADAVAPSAPREEAGYYWGYAVRSAPSLSAVLTECTFPGGYDFTIGTSERGSPLSALVSPSAEGESSVPQFEHMLIVFGGVAGLEAAVKADEELVGMGVREPEKLFDWWVNLCPDQGSRTIRSEEAVWLGLMGLRDVVLERGKERDE